MAGAWNFVALNQNLPHLCTSSFSERVYMYKNVIAKNLSITHCNIPEALTEAPGGVGATYSSLCEETWLQPSWAASQLCSRIEQPHQQTTLQKPSFAKASASAATAPRNTKRCCFRSYLRKRARRLCFWYLFVGISMFPSLLSALLFSIGTKIYSQPGFSPSSTA